MPRLSWDAVGGRVFETGVDRGVLYVDGVGVPWNGLVSIDENPTGGSATPYWIDGVKYLNLATREEYEATINAVYSPVEFDSCDGTEEFRVGVFVTQQRRKTFDFSYRSRLGNDIVGTNYGYRIHIIYNALATPSQRKYTSLSDTPDLQPLAWDITTKPVVVPGYMFSSHLIIDSTKVPSFAMDTLESILYGDDSHTARMPDPTEIASIFEDSVEFVVTDTGDGETFSISGSEFSVLEGPTDTFTLTSAGVSLISSDIAEVSSA